MLALDAIRKRLVVVRSDPIARQGLDKALMRPDGIGGRRHGNIASADSADQAQPAIPPELLISAMRAS